MEENVYDKINSRIFELLEGGTVPWKQPWSSSMPKNLVSKRGYRGINVFILSCQPYSSPYWLTYKQCAELGGHVIRGAKSTEVIFWKMIDRTDFENEDASPGKMAFLRYYNVFNLEQCEGIEAPPAVETYAQLNPIGRADEIVANMPLLPEITFGGDRAFYSPILDYVKLPPRKTFTSSEEYYSTCFHELVHSTGHQKRLGRKSLIEPSFFGSHEYSKEELVAEMGAAFLCGDAGIHQKIIDNSAAYIKGWMSALKDDRKLLVIAAAQAQKAVDYILNRKHDEADQQA